MEIEQNPNRTRTHIFSQTNRTEPNCQTGRTEQNLNFMEWVLFPALLSRDVTSASSLPVFRRSQKNLLFSAVTHNFIHRESRNKYNTNKTMKK